MTHARVRVRGSHRLTETTEKWLFSGERAMLVLTPEDECALRTIAHDFAHSEADEQTTFDILYRGFALYGDVEVAAKHLTRTHYFRDAAQRLLENIGDAGQTYEDACTSLSLQKTLDRIVRSLGVPAAEVDDVIQEVHLRALRYQWIEKYNPTRSALWYYLTHMIRNLLTTWHSRESTRVTRGAVRLDGCTNNNGSGFRSCLYVRDTDAGTLEEQLDTEEVIARFLTYLDVQPPFRVRVHRGFRFLCTLLPPGTADLPCDEETTLFYLGGRQQSCRVTTWELSDLGISYKVPCQLLVDYIRRHPATGEPLLLPGTAEWDCQKHYPNAAYDPQVLPVRERRTLKDIYLFLRDAFPLDEIAQHFGMPATSMPAWVQRLEKCFLDFLVVDALIPRQCKLLAVPTYQCPDCQRLHWKRRLMCSCGCDLRRETKMIRFNAYPWERAYVTRATQERLGGRREPLEVTQGFVSMANAR